jgi:quinoprotein relay system zinc metallohydrolase 1
MMLSRRAALGLIAATPATARAEAFAGRYAYDPQSIGPGIWLVRGADEAIAFGNGGAIANAVILACPQGGAVLFDCGPSLRYAQGLAAIAQKLTGGPLRRVFLSHLHPDHALGSAAFDPAIVMALPATRTELQRDGNGFADAMYRILADWMRGTGFAPPGATVTPGPIDVGGRKLLAMALAGHSDGDLVLVDLASGILLAGDLVFHDRAPATPDANLARWRQSLATLAALPARPLVPGHGPFDPAGTAAIAQTLDWLDWLDQALNQAVSQGLDTTEAGALPIPERFASMKLARYELQRSVSHFYAAIEAQRLPRIDDPTP